MKAQIYALVHDDFSGDIFSLLAQPIEELDNIMYGGRSNISQTIGWNFYLLASSEAGFAAMAGMDGFIRLAELSEDGGWFLEALPVNEEDLPRINEWLAAESMTEDDGSDQFALVERIGRHFTPSFSVSETYLG
jgi:hypothetical protein